MTSRRARAGLFPLFLSLCLTLAWPTLRWPMVYNDLHLIRPYARAELIGAFHGTWDPDRIETGGFRPLTTLFNHARAVAFGENLTAQHLFVIGLFSLYLAALVPLASRFAQTTFRAAFVGGLLALFSYNSTYHYVFLADGVHALQGLAFVGAAPPASLYLGGLLRRVISGMSPVGNAPFDRVSLVLSVGGWAILVALGLLVALWKDRMRWRTPAVADARWAGVLPDSGAAAGRVLDMLCPEHQE